MRTRRARCVLAALLVAALAVALVPAMPTIGAATAELGDVKLGWLAVAVAVELRAMGAYARLQGRLFRAAGGTTTLRSMMALTLAGNALNMTLPGGIVVADGYSLKRLRAHGASTSGALFTVTASSLLSVACFSRCPPAPAWARRLLRRSTFSPPPPPPPGSSRAGAGATLSVPGAS